MRYFKIPLPEFLLKRQKKKHRAKRQKNGVLGQKLGYDTRL